MKVILFGSTGMVGQGALKACLADPEVTQVLAVNRSSLGQTHPKLKEILHKDFFDFKPIEKELTGYDACFFCLGVSSAGMNEDKYTVLTYDLTMAAAKVLARINPAMTFIYVSGSGTDSGEKGSMMWARVKGKTENDLLKLPFKAVYLFRPGAIEPMDGIVPKNKWLGWLLAVMKPLFPILRVVFPKYVTTTRQLGGAMVRITRSGVPSRVVESWDINKL
jgi:uncharacterized protein YbjT (DUF2867 family)